MALIDFKQLSPTGSLFVSGSIILTGSLYINGDIYSTGSIYTDKLSTKKGFINLLSGSATLQDGGIILQYADGSGSAIYLNTSESGLYGRPALSHDVALDSTSVVPDEFIISVKILDSAPSGSPTWGGNENGQGNMAINSQTGDLYIWF